MNPFTLDKEGRPFPLDMRGELDDTAAFKSRKKWGDLDFPLPFGRSMTSAEEYVHEMDEKTGASLKLSILNPKVSLFSLSLCPFFCWSCPHAFIHQIVSSKPS